ncbi:MAG: type I methionyl aminopeptidase [Minisyncoccia bacterium]
MIINNEEEREGIRTSGKHLGEILDLLRDYVTPGVSTQTLEDRAREMMATRECKPAFLNYTPRGAKRAYPAALCVSVNDEIVHGIPNENAKILQDGDVVTLDAGLSWNGFFTDSAITVPVGTVDPEVLRMIACTEEALEAGIFEARAGNRLGDIGYAVEAVAKKYKLHFPKELGGHGVGRAVHEEPFIYNYGRQGQGEKIEEGMVLAIEPMFMLGSPRLKLLRDGYTYVTVDGKKSAHQEHTVIVTNGDPEVVTRAS